MMSFCSWPIWFRASKAIPPVRAPSPMTGMTKLSSFLTSLAIAIPIAADNDVELCPVSRHHVHSPTFLESRIILDTGAECQICPLFPSEFYGRRIGVPHPKWFYLSGCQNIYEERLSTQQRPGSGRCDRRSLIVFQLGNALYWTQFL